MIGQKPDADVSSFIVSIRPPQRWHNVDTTVWIITDVTEQVSQEFRAALTSHQTSDREGWQLFFPYKALSLHLCLSAAASVPPLPHTPHPLSFILFFLPHCLFLCPRLNSLTHSVNHHHSPPPPQSSYHGDHRVQCLCVCVCDRGWGFLWFCVCCMLQCLRPMSWQQGRGQRSWPDSSVLIPGGRRCGPTHARDRNFLFFRPTFRGSCPSIKALTFS